MEKYIKKLIKATDLFGKVNTQLAKLPNPYILTYVLEAIDNISSNIIENIHTTVDEAYDGIVQNEQTPFYNYREALKLAHKKLETHEIIRDTDIRFINKHIRGVDGEYRKGPAPIKDRNNKIIHEPIDAQLIPDKMSELLKQIHSDPKSNNPILHALDIHHKFEYIHPFYDGNGRTGRILFALLLCKYKILDIPASVFSYSISNSKDKYYRALKLADAENKEEYYFLMLVMLNESLELTLQFIAIIQEKIKMFNSDNVKKNEICKYLFFGLKTTNRYICKKTGYNNKTISKYVDIFEQEGLIIKEKKNKYVAYKNVVLEKCIRDVFIDLK